MGDIYIDAQSRSLLIHSRIQSKPSFEFRCLVLGFRVLYLTSQWCELVVILSIVFSDLAFAVSLSLSSQIAMSISHLCRRSRSLLIHSRFPSTFSFEIRCLIFVFVSFIQTSQYCQLTVRILLSCLAFQSNAVSPLFFACAFSMTNHAFLSFSTLSSVFMSFLSDYSRSCFLMRPYLFFAVSPLPLFSDCHEYWNHLYRRARSLGAYSQRQITSPCSISPLPLHDSTCHDSRLHIRFLHYSFPGNSVAS